MELICRAAAQADLPACCNVFADSEIYERYFSAPGALARSLENALNAGELYVACGSAGEVLGVMRIRAKGFCGLYPYLALIGAAPRARGRGVGHFLLAEFEAMARVQGASRTRCADGERLQRKGAGPVPFPRLLGIGPSARRRPKRRL